MIHLFAVLATCCTILLQVTKGNDPSVGLGSGAGCFRARQATGCWETLLEVFEPTVPYTDTNAPDTLLFLFTRANPRFPEYLHDCGGRLPTNTNFDREQKTVLVVHGWLDGTCRTAWMREYRDEFLRRGPYNVILVDWTWGNTPDYFGAGFNTRVVGEQIAFVVNNIVEQTGTDPSRIHIIGHSFGSHIAGFAGKRIDDLGRITALDPALAPFKYSPPESRLCRNDAIYVDVIHSNGGDCGIAENIGFDIPLGHADFYPNGGSVQPSCVPYIGPSVLKRDIFYAFISTVPIFCNHLQSIQFFKTSINPHGCEFISVESDSYDSFQSGINRSCASDGSKCAVMGLNFDCNNFKREGKTRTYYLRTSLLCPYCDNTGIDQQGFYPSTNCYE